MRVAKEVRCVWIKRPRERGVYDCLNCKTWTAHLQLYRISLCSALDRRKVKRRKHDLPI